MARYKRPAMAIFSFERTLFGEIQFDMRSGVSAVTAAIARDGRHYDDGRICGEFAAAANVLWSDRDPYGSRRVTTEMIWRYLIAYFEIETKLLPAQIDRIFCEAACRVRPNAEAADILELLANRLVRTAVAADVLYSAAWVEDVIDAAFPNHMLEFTVCSSEFIFGRGEKKFFEILQSKAAISMSDIWYIGSDPAKDVDAADEAGMVPFWYRGDLPASGIRPPRCDYVAIDEWARLASIISELIPF